MNEQCSCGQHIEGDDLPGGKFMAICHEVNGPLVRAVILFHDFAQGDIGEDGEPEVLYRTGWFNSPKKAEREALYRYWPLYEFKHGFKHPDDPRRTVDDAPPTQHVMTASVEI